MIKHFREKYFKNRKSGWQTISGRRSNNWKSAASVILCMLCVLLTAGIFLVNEPAVHAYENSDPIEDRVWQSKLSEKCGSALTLPEEMKTRESVIAAESGMITEPEQLYALSAVLLDADSGRVLFAKNGQEERAMASTTKIMTCILVLEHGKLDEAAEVSAEAASQPEVHLGVRQGEKYRVRDLLYSLMLESHNDSAVVLAEYAGGSVKGFADMMNQKAKELGLDHTYFLTPNGLDASDESGFHHTTAEDLARIMKYCIMDSPQKDAFLEITRTASYTFSNADGTRNFTCNNHNAFLQMMEGALSGKTGFTGEAGYCYVGALRQDERTFIVALLGCGWPNNRSYKWSDTRKLMLYGLEYFHYRDIYEEIAPVTVSVTEGVSDCTAKVNEEKISPGILNPEKDPKKAMLLRDDERVTVKADYKKFIEAPVAKGTQIGSVSYLLNGEEMYSYPIETVESVGRRDFSWCFRQVLKRYLCSKL